MGEYIGHTAVRTRAVIDKAKGGVLFVDEAYRLSRGSASNSRDFGPEAIDELMKDLEDGDPILIVAGYGDEMVDFMKSNPGLQRRVGTTWNLPDYSCAELATMFWQHVENQDFQFNCYEDASVNKDGVIPQTGGGSQKDNESLSQKDIADGLSKHTTPHWRKKHNGSIKEMLFRRSLDILNKRVDRMLKNPADATLELLRTFKKPDVMAAIQDLQTA